jgi:beta-glucosidase
MTMKKTLLAAVLTLSATLALAQPRLTKDNIDEVIRAMTLEEKATILVGSGHLFREDGTPYGMEAKVPGAAGTTRPMERFGIPGTVLADGPAGVRIDPRRPGKDQTYHATGFPVGTLVASSWNTDMVEEMARAVGEEVHEYGVDVLLGPGMNIQRNPLCGRNFEYFSEDPLLTGKIAAAYVRGVQSNGVGTSIKHFAANSQENNRTGNNARITERTLREIYLKGFEIAVKEAKPWTVMSSYNIINGTYAQQRKDLLTTLLREEWGYRGLVLTDWWNNAGTVKSAWAGNDLMDPGAQSQIDRLVAGVQDGSLAMEDLDRNVRNMLEYIVKTPAFKGYEYSDKPDLKAHAQVARRMAAESSILLKNEVGTLPLKGVRKVALYGITSLDFVAGGTGSGHVHRAYVVNMEQALENAGFEVDKNLTDYYRSQIAAYEAKKNLSVIPDGSFGYGKPKIPEVEVPKEAIVREAKENDIAIFVLGRNAGEENDRRIPDDFDLTETERTLLRQVVTEYHALGKKVVVVLNIGGVIETVSWKGSVDAILLPWSPGQEGANAVVDILTGKVNPSGKLPMTFPVDYMDHPSSKNYPYEYDQNAFRLMRGREHEPVRNVEYTNYEEGIWVGYRYFNTVGKEVSYPFGFGLSYTEFAFSKPVVKATADGFEASVTVTNTGTVAGKEVVQLYVTAPEAGLAKPSYELKAFAKTRELAPGESQTLTLKVDNYDLASYNEASSAWETPAGNYLLSFGSSVADIRATARYQLKKAGKWQANRLFELDAPMQEMTFSRR